MEIVEFILMLMFLIGFEVTILNNKAKTKILKINSSRERVEYRRAIYKKRRGVIVGIFCIPIFVFFLYIGLSVVYTLASVGETQENLEMLPMYLIWLLFFLFIIVAPWGYWAYSSYRGNLSYIEKSVFLLDPPSFVLYLRGFEKDDYSDRFHLTIGKKNNFSEYKFTKLISKFYVCVAIGMTKELDAPLGAKRIYVDDFTWKDDVNELMKESDYIFILMNNRPSCIWEIVAAIKYIEKVVFIVDDPIKYELIQEEVKDYIKFPHIPDMALNDRFYFLQHKENGFVYYKYDNNEKGYKAIIKKLYEK